MKKSKNTRKDKKILGRSSPNNKSRNNPNSINSRNNKRKNKPNNVPSSPHFTPTTDPEGSSMNSSSINTLTLKKSWRKESK